MNYEESNQYEEAKKRMRLLNSLFPITTSWEQYEEKKSLMYVLNKYDMTSINSNFMWYDKYNKKLLVIGIPILRFYYMNTEYWKDKHTLSKNQETWD